MSLFVRDWTIVSPLAIGKAPFIEAVREVFGQITDPGRLPDDVRVRRFEQFDKKAHLGNKGVRGMDNLGAYATVASQLLVTADPRAAERDKSRVGVVLGTGSGSLRVHVDFIRDLHTQERVEWVDPIQFPQTVMNCAAGQVGIWHRFTGVNTTVSGGYHSGASALAYAENLFLGNRVDQVLVGCVEEHSPYSRYLFPVDSRRLRSSQRLGEGCAMFRTAPASDADDDAELFGYRRLGYLRNSDPKQVVTELAKRIDVELKNRYTRQYPLRRICFNAFTTHEPTLIEALRQESEVARSAQAVCSNAVLADCVSATTGFQIALLLALHEEEAGKPAIDLVVTFDSEGGVAVTLVKQGRTI